MLLEGKVSFITGGARGIGRAIAELFAEEGSDIAILDVLEKEMEDAANEISVKTGRKVKTYNANIAKIQEIVRVVECIIKDFGRIDVLVNNAGIHQSFNTLNCTEEAWDKVFNINVKGLFFCSQAVARHMVNNRTGKIINISSTSGKVPHEEEAVYGPSKAAVIGITRTMGFDLGPYGINVNAICPGFTETEMTKEIIIENSKDELERKERIKEWIERSRLRRLGRPIDQARACLFLASYLSDHVVGEAIVVSGGELIE